MSGGTIEIITGHERRRRWSVEEKLRIVAESRERGARVTEVAARHGVYPGLLFTWRRQVRDGVLTPPPPAVFTPVRMLEPIAEAKADTPSRSNGTRAAQGKLAQRSEPIEIILSNGCRLRIDLHVDARALRRIVDVLRG